MFYIQSRGTQHWNNTFFRFVFRNLCEYRIFNFLNVPIFLQKILICEALAIAPVYLWRRICTGKPEFPQERKNSIVKISPPFWYFVIFHLEIGNSKNCWFLGILIYWDWFIIRVMSASKTIKPISRSRPLLLLLLFHLSLIQTLFW